MNNWPDRRILDLFGIEHPILQAPMAGASTPRLAIEVSNAGGLGALACAMLSVKATRADLAEIRTGASGPVNLNFFCHEMPVADVDRETAWRARLAPYYAELGLEAPAADLARSPFDGAFCALIEESRPEVVSFHFGLPPAPLLARVRASGARIIASATTVAEARWLESRGCDAIIAMGAEAGGHRASFLSLDMSRQVGTFALVPQIVDAVDVPVIAAGGVADARGMAAALTLGASAVQIGTAYLFSPEAGISAVHRGELGQAVDDSTAITNVFTGRPARSIVNRLVREVGPLSALAPTFPLAAGAVAPLRAASGAAGSPDFVTLWSGQAAALAYRLPAGEFTRRLAAETLARLGLS